MDTKNGRCGLPFLSWLLTSELFFALFQDTFNSMDLLDELGKFFERGRLAACVLERYGGHAP